MKILRTIIQHNFIFKYNKRYISNKGNLLTTDLPNGLHVVTEETGSSLACISLFARVGSRFETYETNGISHFIEHMAYRGFCTMNKDALENTLNDIGARMNAVTTREFQVFTATCPSNRASDIVALLAKIVTDLELSEAEMEFERQNINQEMQDNEVDPKAVTFDYLHETAFQGTPLAQRVIGPSRNINRFNRDCAFSFMKNNYTPLRLLLATSGGVSHSSISESARQHFGNMACEGEGANFGPRRFSASQVLYRDDSMPFAHIAIALEAPGYSSIDYLPLLVAKNFVGSWDRSQGGSLRHASYLARAAASDNFCERFESFYIPYSDVGLWGVYFVSPRMEIENMIYNIQNTWMYLSTMIDKNDVQRAVNITKLELARRVEGAVNSCFDIGLQIMVKNERTPLSNLYEELSHLNSKIMKEVADSYIYNKNLTVAAVGPTEALPDYNRLQAGQYWLRL